MPRCRVTLALIALSCCAAATLRAQSEDGSQPGYTLHVYANRLQVPTLVLSNTGKPVPKLTRERFQISLDQGPKFTPTLVRLEGQDPITFSLLLDASGDENTLFPHIADGFRRIPAGIGLQPHDHVSVYSLDCGLFRSLADVPADTADIGAAIANSLSIPHLHGGVPKGNCRKSLRLYDALAHIARQMSSLPGRRVLLLLSEGRDSTSELSLTDLVHVAGDGGVAIFVLRDRYTHEGYRQLTPNFPGVGRGGQHFADADPVSTLAARSGGLVFNVDPKGIGEKLAEMFTDIRGRYILEFPRPDSDQGGMHGLDIFVPSLFDPVIRAAGVSAPLPDPSVLNDPNTVRSAPSPAVYGSHRPSS